MSTYLLINICIIIIPLIFSFEKKIQFYKKLSSVIISIISAGIIFVIWEIIAVNRKDWSFNPEYISGITIFNLPMEEILFFITVPYSIIFIYECLKYHLKDKVYQVNFFLPIFIVVIFLMIGFIFHNKYCTSTVFLFCGLLILLIALSSDGFTISKVTMVTVVISFIPLTIVNYILTSLPVVMYDHNAILGIRVTSIPIEDFVYSLSMISGWLFIYTRSERFSVTKKHLLNFQRN